MSARRKHLKYAIWSTIAIGLLAITALAVFFEPVQVHPPKCFQPVLKITEFR